MTLINIGIILYSMKTISLQITEKQLQKLNRLKTKAGIPRAVMIRFGIDLILRQYEEHVIFPDDMQAYRDKDKEGAIPF